MHRAVYRAPPHPPCLRPPPPPPPPSPPPSGPGDGDRGHAGGGECAGILRRRSRIGPRHAGRGRAPRLASASCAAGGGGLGPAAGAAAGRPRRAFGASGGGAGFAALSARPSAQSSCARSRSWRRHCALPSARPSERQRTWRPASLRQAWRRRSCAQALSSRLPSCSRSQPSSVRPWQRRQEPSSLSCVRRAWRRRASSRLYARAPSPSSRAAWAQRRPLSRLSSARDLQPLCRGLCGLRSRGRLARCGRACGGGPAGSLARTRAHRLRLGALRARGGVFCAHVVELLVCRVVRSRFIERPPVRPVPLAHRTSAARSSGEEARSVLRSTLVARLRPFCGETTVLEQAKISACRCVVEPVMRCSARTTRGPIGRSFPVAHSNRAVRRQRCESASRRGQALNAIRRREPAMSNGKQPLLGGTP